jgi:glutaconyl-CoA decarboxylase
MFPYWKNMDPLGKALKENVLKRMEKNREQIAEVEQGIEREIDRVKNAGLPVEKIHQRGQMTVWERLEYLVDSGTWHPLHTLYNPQENEEGTTGVVDGLAKINGKWAVVIGFDNKVLAGAWIPGQAENILRVTDMAKKLNVPLVWLVNCSGVKLTMQEEVYPDRRGNGTPFYRHAELEKMGIPVLAGIYGTNPAGGGYQGISPTLLLAHKDCNIAVGGGGIVGGMSPKGYFDMEGAQQLIEATRHFRATPPGRTEIHYDQTGFFREVHEEETGVLDALKRWMDAMPAYDPAFFRVDEPKQPAYPIEDTNSIVQFNQKMVYDFDNFLARLIDGSEHMEFRPDFGPEVYCGLA